MWDWTDPSTWAAGNEVTASRMNVEMRDNLLFRYSPPRARAHHDGNQSLELAIRKPLDFNKTIFDNDNMHATRETVSAPKSAVMWCNHAGRYLATACAKFANDPGSLGIRFLGISTSLVDDNAVFTLAANPNVGLTYQTTLSCTGSATLTVDDPIVALVQSFGLQNIDVVSVHPATPSLAVHWIGGS